MPEVIITITSPNGTRQIPFAGERMTLGRTDASDISIADDTGLSRRHLTLRRTGAQVFAFDENSTNGSRLNNQTLTHDGAQISETDELRIGNSTVVKIKIATAQPAASQATPVDAPPPTTDAVAATDAPSARRAACCWV
jgi:pSer/pThr/pTyr-binding forkhead associated (FHA) protein